MNGPTCAALWARPSFWAWVGGEVWGSCPFGHPAGHGRGDWWPRLLMCVWGSGSWSCPALRWSFPLTGWGLSGAPNWTVKTHRAVWYITVDTDRPGDLLPLSLHCCLEALMKICGHFESTISHIIIHSHALVTLQKMSNVSDDKGCFNSIFFKMENV